MLIFINHGHECKSNKLLYISHSMLLETEVVIDIDNLPGTLSKKLKKEERQKRVHEWILQSNFSDISLIDYTPSKLPTYKS